MTSRSKRVPVREPFCPLGCKTPSGSIHRIGMGSCADCVQFQKQSVLQQGKISAQLIADEDAQHFAATQRLIPAAPPSPEGKRASREATDTIVAALAFVIGLHHQKMSGFGGMPQSPVSKKSDNKKVLAKKKVDLPQDFALSADVSGKGGDSSVSCNPTALSSLTKVLEIGQEIEIQDFAGQGRGLASKVEILKSQYVCHYDGDRVDSVTGQRLMLCKRTRANLLNLPADIQGKLRALEYCKNWAVTLNRGTNISVHGGTRNIVIDGTLAASPLLDSFVDRGLIGPGSLMNSSQNTGMRPNCILIFVPWPSNCFSVANFFVPTTSEMMMAILVAKCYIPPNTQLTWDYSYASHIEALPLQMGPGRAPTLSPDPITRKQQQGFTRIVCSDCSGKPQRCSTCLSEDPEVIEDPSSDSGLSPVLPPTRMEERVRAAGSLKCSEIKDLIKNVMDVLPSIVPAEFRIYNVSNKFSHEELRQWCAGQALRMETARLKRFKTLLSARDSVEACMRMLAIFSNDQHMQTLYLHSRALPTQKAMDSGSFGDDHPFWAEMHSRFHNSTDYFLAFPFDYIPTAFKVVNTQGIPSEFAPPKTVEEGFLSGLNLLHARKPSLYADYFFTKKKLQDLWKQSLADYRYLFKPCIHVS